MEQLEKLISKDQCKFRESFVKFPENLSLNLTGMHSWFGRKMKDGRFLRLVQTCTTQISQKFLVRLIIKLILKINLIEFPVQELDGKRCQIPRSNHTMRNSLGKLAKLQTLSLA